jgi:hypothetical protein
LRFDTFVEELSTILQRYASARPATQPGQAPVPNGPAQPHIQG